MWEELVHASRAILNFLLNLSPPQLCRGGNEVPGGEGTGSAHGESVEEPVDEMLLL